MNSGIYVLTFKDGNYYIGKSDNIPKRWQQHWKDFEKGTHARRMQECYDQYGEPEAQVFLRCHRDHVDLYESIIIRMNLGPKCLNGAIPWEVPPDEVETLMNNGQYIEESTAEHFRRMNRLCKRVEDLECEVEELDSALTILEREGIRTPAEIESTMAYLNKKVASLVGENLAKSQKLETLKKLSLFQRVFRYHHYTV